jgi:hypothetical protein
MASARPQAGVHLRPGAGSLGRFYAGRHRPILVHLSPEVAERMQLFLADWPHEAAAGYRLTKANGESDDISHVLDTANRLVGALIEAFVAQDPQLVCFHAATICFKDGLATFVGDSHTGKSSLSLHSGAAGHPFFGDDQLALDLGQDPPAGNCLGLAPKARLALPPEGGASYERFIADCRAAMPGDVAYLRLCAGEAASFGASAPLATLILPVRCPDGGESFEPAHRATVVRTVLENVYAPHLATGALVPRIAVRLGGS